MTAPAAPPVAPLDRASLERVREQILAEQKSWQELVTRGRAAIAQGEAGLQQAAGALATLDRLLEQIGAPPAAAPAPPPAPKRRRPDGRRSRGARR